MRTDDAKRREAPRRAAPTPINPAPLADLGPGHPLTNDLLAQLEPTFGTALKHVRIHTDVVGQATGALSIGNHIAFAPGRFRPGSAHGNALLAHEITHVLQQSNTTGATTTSEQALEAEAEAAAHATLTGHHPPSPTLRTTTRVQHADEPQDQFTTGTAADTWAREHGIGVRAQPMIAVAPQGMTMRFSLQSLIETLPRRVIYAREWIITDPDGHTFVTNTQEDRTAHLTFIKAGSYSIEAVLRLGEHSYVTIRHRQEVTETASLLDTAFAKLPATPSSVRYSAGLELRHLELSQYGIKDQSALGIPYITSSADNPARPRRGGDLLGYAVYTVTPSPGARSHRWYAQPSTPLRWHNYHGFLRIVRDGRETYDLGSSGTSAPWFIAAPNVYRIVCEEFDDTGKPLNTTARYLQVVLREQEQSALVAWDAYSTEAKRHLNMLDNAIGARAVYLNMTSGEQTELPIFLGQDRQQQDRTKLVDLTPGVSRREYTGRTAEDALSDFRDGNAYPQGIIRIDIAPSITKTYETTGKSVAGVVSAGFGWASLGLTGLAILLAATGVGAAVVVPVLLLGAAGAGAVSAGASLYDRLKQAEINPLGVALDLASLAASIVGGATAFKALRHGAPVMFTTRSGRFLLWANAVTGATAGVLMTVEAVDAITKILDDPNLSPEQQSDAIVRILAMIALNAALIGISFSDLLSIKTRINAALGSELAGALSTETIYTLSLLSDDALHTLASTPKGEIDEFVRVIRRDPVAATALLRIRPFRTAKELENAVETLLKMVNEPKGVFLGLDTDHPPSNWKLHNTRTDEDRRVKVLRTEVEYTDPATGQVRKGYFIRAYNPKTRTFQMREAFLGNLPGKIVHESPALTETGTPTVTYVTLYQAKRLGATYQGLARVTMKQIENFDTICQLAWLQKKYPAADIDALILETDSIKYGKTSIIQAGSEITGATVIGGKRQELSKLLDDYVHSDERGIRRTFAEGLKERARQDALLARYGLSRQDEVLSGFDIELTLQPYTVP
ncbi:DUF4157 domain-containing protein [Streptomyces sp. NPDC005374]|uniref:eCIS core domain-containing protein n=1 Tax=Streptomyces sp. NPDC005374 TaxID=3364713 RepID=UPI0036AE81F8